MSRGRRSSLEDHKDRAAILESIARRVPVKQIAAQYGVSHWSLYRWITSNRPKQDREERRALRKLKAATHTDHLETVGGDDLASKFSDLEIQKKTLLAAQMFATKIGDVQKIATISDTIARNVRHSAALGEILRIRQQTPATHFTGTAEYRQLRLDLLSAVRLSPAAAEQVARVLQLFERCAAPVIPDEYEAQY